MRDALRRERLLWERAPVRYALLQLGPFAVRGPRDAAELRYWLTPAVPDRVYLHGHHTDGPDRRYPLLQYKVLRDFVGLLALEEAVDDAVEVARRVNAGSLRLGPTEGVRGRFVVPDDERATALASRTQRTYQFATPWIPFRERHAKAYAVIGDGDRSQLLRHLLIQHVVALAQGLDRTIPFDLDIDFDLQPIRGETLTYRGETVHAFSGSFRLPVHLPPFAGLGRGAAIGYGAAVEC